jgi:tetratricopeptide (TPR) repeat protein
LALLSITACKTDTAEHKAAGNLLFNQGEYEKARVEYAKAVEATPGDPGARTLLGNALIELGEYEDARGEFGKALEQSSDSPEAHRGMMTVISHTATPGDGAAFDEYLGHARAIIDARPKDKNAIIVAGAILSESANPADAEAYAKAQAEAEKYLKRGLKIDDRDPKLLFHLALVYARKGEIDVAERVVERIRLVDPKPGFADYAAAIVYTIAGQRDKAIASVEALLEVDSIDPATLLAKSSYLAPLHGNARFTSLVQAALAARSK